MCYLKNNLDSLRTCVKIITIFEIFFLAAKVCCQSVGMTYYAYNCINETAETLMTETFCQSADDLIHKIFAPAVMAGRMEAIIGILALDLGDLLIGTIKYFAVKYDNSSGSKLSFRLGILLWLIGITFWLYLFHASIILIFAIILVYILRYLILLCLRKYLVALEFHKTHGPWNDNGAMTDEEVTKF